MNLETLAQDMPLAGWEKPIPLRNGIEQHAHHHYPASCLPSIIYNAVMEYQQYGQQPVPLIACSALANVSLACQTLANIARDTVLVSPVSLYFLVIAKSGDRKTIADHTLSHAIRQWEQQTRQKLTPYVKVARALHQTWYAEKEGMLGQIRRAKLSPDIGVLKEKFADLLAEEPPIPLLPTLFLKTPPRKPLPHTWRTAGLALRSGAMKAVSSWAVTECKATPPSLSRY